MRKAVDHGSPTPQSLCEDNALFASLVTWLKESLNSLDSFIVIRGVLCSKINLPTMPVVFISLPTFNRV